jgi:bifunctional ADP-heptose synthase (sugar kinase/adenylyltransferase)
VILSFEQLVEYRGTVAMVDGAFDPLHRGHIEYFKAASIAYTHVNQFDTETVLRQLRPRYYVKGRDWVGRLPADQVAICGEHGIEIVYLDTVVDSSSRILQQFTMEQRTHR